MRIKDTAQVTWKAMRPMAFMVCLLGNTVARPARTRAPPEKPAGQSLMFPHFVQDPSVYQMPMEMSPQFFNFDPMNALYENYPFILNAPQLQFLPPGRQTQILQALNFLPFPTLIPQQYGVNGQTFFPTISQTGPLAETDGQITIIIQHTGGSSSEEGNQQIVINGLPPIIPGGPNMGIKNEEEEPTGEALGPEGILPNPENPEIPGPAHQGNAPPTEGSVPQTEPVFVSGPEPESPSGVLQEGQQATGAAKVKTGSPCDRQATTPGGQKMPASSAPSAPSAPPDPVENDIVLATQLPLPLGGRRGNGRRRHFQRRQGTPPSPVMAPLAAS